MIQPIEYICIQKLLPICCKSIEKRSALEERSLNCTLDRLKRMTHYCKKEKKTQKIYKKHH